MGHFRRIQPVLAAGRLPLAPKSGPEADASDAEVREALGTGLPRHPLHKINASARLARAAPGRRVDALGAPHTGERSEGQLIRDFIEKIVSCDPQLITFNGHSFDLRQYFRPLHGGRA